MKKCSRGEKCNRYDAQGYCMVTSRLGWLKRTDPASPEIPELEEVAARVLAHIEEHEDLLGLIRLTQ